MFLLFSYPTDVNLDKTEEDFTCLFEGQSRGDRQTVRVKHLTVDRDGRNGP